MKPALKSSFYLKIKNESNHLIGLISCTLSSSSSFRRRCFKKSWDHHFCDHLEIVILSFDLHRLLKDMQNVPEINFTWLRNALEFSKMTKNLFNQLVGNLFQNLNDFFTRKPLRGAILKFQMARWILKHIPEKISPQGEFS